MLTEEAAKLTLGQKSEVLTPHQVQGILEMKGHLWLTGNRLTKYQALLLDNSEVTIKTCNTLNPASLMPTESSPDLTHSCSNVINLTLSSRTDFLNQSLRGVLAKFLPPPVGEEDRENNLDPLKDCICTCHTPSLTNITPPMPQSLQQPWTLFHYVGLPITG